MIKLILKFFITTSTAFSLSTNAAITIQQPAANLDTPLLNGLTIKANELRGKVVLQMFWATWCPSCRKELPQLQAFYVQHRNQGFEILALSIDDSETEVKEFLKDKKYTFPIAMRHDGYFERYGKINGTPTYYLLDKKGVVREIVIGPFPMKKLENLVKKFLAEP